MREKRKTIVEGGCRKGYREQEEEDEVKSDKGQRERGRVKGRRVQGDEKIPKRRENAIETNVFLKKEHEKNKEKTRLECSPYARANESQLRCDVVDGWRRLRA